MKKTTIITLVITYLLHFSLSAQNAMKDFPNDLKNTTLAVVKLQSIPSPSKKKTSEERIWLHCVNLHNKFYKNQNEATEERMKKNYPFSIVFISQAEFRKDSAQSTPKYKYVVYQRLEPATMYKNSYPYHTYTIWFYNSTNRDSELYKGLSFGLWDDARQFCRRVKRDLKIKDSDDGKDEKDKE